MTTLHKEQRQAARQLRHNRPSSERPRFRRDDDASDYPVGYLAQLARPFLSRRHDRPGSPKGTPKAPPGASAGSGASAG